MLHCQNLSQQEKHKASILYKNSRKYKFRPNIKEIQKYIVFLLDILCSAPTEVNVKFCDIDEMIQTNTQFRDKHKATDVLSFVPQSLFNQNSHFLGDILICVPVCIQQAKRAHHSLSSELLKMLTHALVHLKGFDHDRSDSAERVMSKLERFLRNELIKQFGQPHFEKENRLNAS